MSNGVYTAPYPANEPVKGYAPGSEEKESLLANADFGFFYDCNFSL